VSDPLEEIRARIDATDRAIVEAVNERLRLVTELWELKEMHGAPRYDPDRERSLRDALAAANAGPLSAEGLDALVDELLALTKRELSRNS
jgi:chorismate mutase/prephenate dehydrogenase